MKSPWFVKYHIPSKFCKVGIHRKLGKFGNEKISQAQSTRFSYKILQVKAKQYLNTTIENNNPCFTTVKMVKIAPFRIFSKYRTGFGKKRPKIATNQTGNNYLIYVYGFPTMTPFHSLAKAIFLPKMCTVSIPLFPGKTITGSEVYPIMQS